jgi:CTP:molybdopterin cytidylyltransferase MocA
MTSEIFAVVLAAGSASRFGSTKQLTDLDGSPMVWHAVRTATRACGERTLLVTGHDSAAVSRACAGLPGFVTVNDTFDHGIGNSIAHAVKALPAHASAILVLLADQPLVRAQHLQAIVAAWSGNDDEIVASSYDGTRGPPVLFPRGCFADLTALDGDHGGRHLFDDERFRVTTIACEAAALDVDTVGDLKSLRGA